MYILFIRRKLNHIVPISLKSLRYQLLCISSVLYFPLPRATTRNITSSALQTTFLLPPPPRPSPHPPSIPFLHFLVHIFPSRLHTLLIYCQRMLHGHQVAHRWKWNKKGQEVRKKDAREQS